MPDDIQDEPHLPTRAPFATLTARSRRSISKTRFMYFRQCNLRAWLMEHDPIEYVTPPIGTVIGMGIEVGILARALVPNGVLIDCDYRDFQTVLDTTKQLLTDPNVTAIFEAGFAHSHCLIRTDIFERRGDGWCLGEVKSATTPKPEHLDELALQVYIMQNCGVNLVDVELILVNNEYVRDTTLDVFGLFNRISVMDQILPRLAKIPELIAENLRILDLADAPEIRPSRHCHEPYECDFWQRCTEKKPKDWVYRIPNLPPYKFEILDNAGIESMRDIPAELPAGVRFTKKQQRIVDAAKTGQIWRSPAILKKDTTALLRPPVGYLDFETFSPAIPFYPACSPYTRIPFQWSYHHDNGSTLIHKEFLASGNGDPRREFAETMLRATLSRKQSPIIVWSAFEATVISELIEFLPDLAPALKTLRRRIIDPLGFTRRNIDHPDFHGSYSLKIVAPVLAPEISYDGLDIHVGTDASVAFYQLVADPELTPDACDTRRQSLLTYCQLDTLALVHVLHWIRTQGKGKLPQRFQQNQTTPKIRRPRKPTVKRVKNTDSPSLLPFLDGMRKIIEIDRNCQGIYYPRTRRLVVSGPDETRNLKKLGERMVAGLFDKYNISAIEFHNTETQEVSPIEIRTFLANAKLKNA